MLSRCLHPLPTGTERVSHTPYRLSGTSDEENKIVWGWKVVKDGHLCPSQKVPSSYQRGPRPPPVPQMTRSRTSVSICAWQGILVRRRTSLWAVVIVGRGKIGSGSQAVLRCRVQHRATPSALQRHCRRRQPIVAARLHFFECQWVLTGAASLLHERTLDGITPAGTRRRKETPQTERKSRHRRSTDSRPTERSAACSVPSRGAVHRMRVSSRCLPFLADRRKHSTILGGKPRVNPEKRAETSIYSGSSQV